MKVVSDTSPILYLLLIDQLDLLPCLYPTITIPDVVQAEMQVEGAPAVLKNWIETPPNWLEILPSPEMEDRRLQRLQPGERAAIALAQTLQANLLIVDDLDARRAAQNLG